MTQSSNIVQLMRLPSSAFDTVRCKGIPSIKTPVCPLISTLLQRHLLSLPGQTHLPESLRVHQLLEKGESELVQPDVHVVLGDVEVEVAALLGVGVQELLGVRLRGRENMIKI